MDETTEALFNEVRAKLQAKDAAGAMHLVWPYVSAHPEDGQGRSFYGMALCMSGHNEEGISELKNACTLMPADAQARFNLAVALHQAGKSTAAKDELNRALQIDPAHASSIAMLETLQNAPAEPVMTPPPVDYASQTPLYGNPQSTSSQAQGGMQFQPAFSKKSSLVTRFFLGIGWGAAYAQYWTLWNIVWLLVFNISRSSVTDLVIISLIYAVVCTVMGSIVGLIVFSMRGNRQNGIVIAIAAGMFLLLVQYLIFRSPTIFLNAIFWYFTGRIVGYRIGLKSERTP